MQELIQYLKATGEALVSGWVWKGVVAVVAVLLGPFRDVHLALLILMGLDLVTGVWRAHKYGELDTTIARRKTVVKLMVYWLVVAASYQLSIIIKLPYPVNVAILYLGATEFISITRNSADILGRQVVPDSLLKNIMSQSGTRGKDENNLHRDSQ